MSVGDKIRGFRMKRGLSQVELARATGESKQTIYKYETGRIKNIPLDKLAIIAAALDVSPVEFTDWESDDTVRVLKQAEAPYGAPVEEVDFGQYLDLLRSRPECRVLLSTAKNATKAEVEENVRFITALRQAKKEND